MRLPRFIRLGHKPVNVTRRNKVRAPGREADGGYYSAFYRELFVATDTPDHQQALDTLHELVHLALDEHEVQMSLRLEERVAEAVSRSFAELINRNPKLFDTIKGALK